MEVIGNFPNHLLDVRDMKDIVLLHSLKCPCKPAPPQSDAANLKFPFNATPGSSSLLDKREQVIPVRSAYMFTNNQRQQERTGRYGTPRVEYLQELVTQFQNTDEDETREKILANLANFAYDPYNYNFLRQLNVLELFIDCLTEPNEKLVEFAMGGICNSCVDPTNSAIITKFGGIPLIIQCLSSPVRNTVNYALGALYYICDESNKDNILKPEVIDVIRRYAAAEEVSVSFSNMAKSFLSKHLTGY
ncbi:hypothetical protein VNO78_18227 [Psophocarpus tetragonolobus]|uniref:Armadillo repeat-containing protein 7 n=1 Tax=Psophocarpus tetragonolobus TaxID=3891 RepID=A0AAN9SKJ0_PSOTE